MSDDRIPAPIESLIRAIAGGADDPDDQRASTFARGLALGALVGAAIAGSTIWQRRHVRPDASVVAAPAKPAAEPLPEAVLSGPAAASDAEPATRP